MNRPAVTTRTGVRPAGHIVLRPGRSSFLVHRRAALVALLLAVLLLAAVVVYLCVGESFVSPAETVNVLLGRPSPDQFVVGTLRLPRLTVGLLAGAAFGVAGALVQTVARNPLASPDIIGVTHGAGAATVAAMSFGLVTHTVLPYLSIAGGLAAALLVYVFAWRRGMHASRFVLIGIGVSVALGSVTQLLLTKGDFLVAQQAKVWLTGSLNSRGYDEAAPLATVLLVAIPAMLWAARAQRGASLDDDTATALGIRLNRVRLGLTALGVVLASVATGACGPVDFVALLAPQIARRLTRTTQIPLLSSALTGALVVVVADLLARRLFSPVELPVGVLTAVVGAPYLMWLIARKRRRFGGGVS
ncbi:iron chelate uptake ABC transporter family permease subunit [Streptomyces sp. DSM 41972]|uniref:Iron chelate uptake ABC transporter family permease subunit n=1 Tax=Streptomyces althioticus subsp. attaecolombicae TaxID=3075534 RepID=A0ABU3I6H0_9ACTN|nr:iron chelate uptake ABC transporter family permease subunit [Streptomyces sp. DSM 41972]SCD87907.1 iron complex transport system permease protein [Streptomyces sp. di50b]SCE10816.1 iron complex transport system permease protein [Streptomyces sp. di188]